MQPVRWRVGDLAKQTGMSIRTLHYYDEIGLLSPSYHTDAGHRLYAAGDIERLQQIKSLRQLGFTLEEIRECLEDPAFSPLHVIGLHAARLREQIELQRKLCDRLDAIAGYLRADQPVAVEEFINIIEAIIMYEKYYTPEQLEELRQRREALGEEGMQKAQADWAELMANVRVEMERGTDPADGRVQQLARQWKELIQAFTGGNPEIENSLRNMYRQEENIAGMEVSSMRQLGEYVERAWKAGGAGQ
jgi:MerR family transcriptional regulator, thiopeptide resistance regulator